MKSKIIVPRSLAIFVIFIVLVSVAPSVRQVHGITTSANLSEWAIPTGGSIPTGLALDPSGNGFWFVEYSGNKVAQFDPSSNTFKEWTIPRMLSPLGWQRQQSR